MTVKSPSETMVIRQLQFLFVLIFPVLGWPQDLYTFSNGEVADAEEVNANFQSLRDEINELRTLLSSLLPALKFDASLDGVVWKTAGAQLDLSEDKLSVILQAGAWPDDVAHVRTADSINQGRHYWEMEISCQDNTAILMLVMKKDSAFYGEDQVEGRTGEFIEWYAINSDGLRYENRNDSGSSKSYFSVGPVTSAAGDVFQVAADMDAGNVYFGKNGVWLDSNPSAGENPTYSGLTGAYNAGIWITSNTCPNRTATFNFGASEFIYAPPTGYYRGYCPTNDCEIAE